MRVHVVRRYRSLKRGNGSDWVRFAQLTMCDILGFRSDSILAVIVNPYFQQVVATP
jgi:hypothetical protein